MLRARRIIVRLCEWQSRSHEGHEDISAGSWPVNVWKKIIILIPTDVIVRSLLTREKLVVEWRRLKTAAFVNRRFSTCLSLAGHK